MNKNTTELIDNLNELKDDIIYSVNLGGSDTNRKLSDRLLELASHDTNNSELYQLISLLNSNIDTDHIRFKKKAIQVINKVITNKIESLTLLQKISDKLDIIEIKANEIDKKINDKSTGFKIPVLGNIKIKDMLLAVLIIFIILFLAFDKNDKAASKTVNTITSPNKVIKVLKNIKPPIIGVNK